MHSEHKQFPKSSRGNQKKVLMLKQVHPDLTWRREATQNTPDC